MPKGFIKYDAYPWTDHDPVIDVLRTAKQQSGMKDITIQNNGGPKAGTMRNWWSLKTKRPQFVTVAAAARAMGMTYLPLTTTERRETIRNLKG